MKKKSEKYSDVLHMKIRNNTSETIKNIVAIEFINLLLYLLLNTLIAQVL